MEPAQNRPVSDCLMPSMGSQSLCRVHIGVGSLCHNGKKKCLMPERTLRCEVRYTVPYADDLKLRLHTYQVPFGFCRAGISPAKESRADAPAWAGSIVWPASVRAICRGARPVTQHFARTLPRVGGSVFSSCLRHHEVGRWRVSAPKCDTNSFFATIHERAKRSALLGRLSRWMEKRSKVFEV